jgi:DNA polymerase III subunit delta'
VPIIDLYGHGLLRARLTESVKAGTLPSSLLFQGARGVGKQRLALWLAELLLCTEKDAPCGTCKACRYTLAITHPDLHWVFPRPRPKDADPDQ